MKNYAVFSGRARRTEYWMFVLFNILVTFAILILEGVMYAAFSSGTMGLLYVLYGLATFVPSLAVAVRRLHDTGKSGWFLLIALIPFVGGIVLLVFLCTDSEPGMNKYGPSPKELAVY